MFESIAKFIVVLILLPLQFGRDPEKIYHEMVWKNIQKQQQKKPTFLQHIITFGVLIGLLGLCVA